MLEIIIAGSACVTLIAVLVWTISSKTRRSLARLPPGPYNFPILGQAFQFSLNRSHLKFTEWSKEHGDIFMFKLFGRNVVILNHPDVIRRAFVSKEFSKSFSDRPSSFVGHFVGDIYKDILFRRYDDTCQKLKNATITAMHSVGDGSDKYNNLVMEEINNYIAEISATPNGNVDLIKPLELSLCRLIGILVTGRLLPSGDNSLKAIRDFDIHGNEIVSPAVHSVFKFFPFLRFLPGYYGNLFRTVMREREQIKKLLVSQMKDQYRTRPEQNLVHSLFHLQDTEDWLTDDLVLGVVMDLINTSTLTSRGSLSGFLLLLVHFQDVQNKIREEVYNVIGKERQPRPEDLQNMPYTHACILEVFRYQSHLGITATHTNTCEDVEFDGFLIPKGSSLSNGHAWFPAPSYMEGAENQAWPFESKRIYGNLWCVHHDERFWSDPWTFRPERFLNQDGSVINSGHDLRSRFHMPFGVGARQCMGINMSYNRMFLYIATLLQTHALLPPSDAQLPPHDPKAQLPGTVLQAPSFVCKVTSL